MSEGVPKWVLGGAGAEVFRMLSEELAGSQLHSLLLEVMRRRAGARTPVEVLAQYQRDRFTSPASIDLREALAIDAHLLAAAADFDAIELSPVAPLATCSAIALTDQNRVLSALRRTEVVSDPTNVLALECASRLRAAPEPVHLATSQRVVRAQPVPDVPGFSQHFRLFALASGGLEARNHELTVTAMARHVVALLDGLDRLEHDGYRFGARRVDLLATPARAELGDRIAAALAGRVDVARRPLEHPYYSGGLRFMLWVTAPDGAELPLGDGGTFDWLARLLSSRRAVFVASGLGAQLVATRFREA